MLDQWRKARTITRMTWAGLFFAIFATVVYAVSFTGQGWAWTLEVDTNGWGGEFRSYYSLWYVCSSLTSGHGIQDCTGLEKLPTVPGKHLFNTFSFA